MKDSKKGFLKCVNGKRQTRNNIGLLLDEHGHLSNGDIDKAETFNAFFASVFNIDDGLGSPHNPGLENHGCENDKLPTNLELATQARSLQVDGVLIGFIQGCLRAG